jgi:F-type H+-transporting ATPase subunit b
MELDLSTIIFQILNFALLVYILKRLLYKPVRRIMDERTERIAANLHESEEARAEAASLRDETRAEVERVKSQRAESLRQVREEVSAERKRLVADAEAAAARILERQNAALAAERRRLEADVDTMAERSMGTFARTVLTGVSGPNIHADVAGRFFEHLPGVVADLRERGAELHPLITQEGPPEAEVMWAFEPTDADRERVDRALAPALGHGSTVRHEVDRALRAGVRVRAFDLVFDYSMAGQVDDLLRRVRKARR